MGRKSIERSLMCLATLILAACAQGPMSTGTQTGDWAVIERLEQQAKAIAKTNG